MARKRRQLTSEEAAELFAELDETGVVDPLRERDRDARRKRVKDAEKTGGPAAVEVLLGRDSSRRRSRAHKVDPLSVQDPSGSKAGEAISRAAIIAILGVLVFVVGMQVVYGVSRRLNTANLSETANVDSVEHAMESGVEWGNGFTQFPTEFTVDEANEKTGQIEVSVVDTESKNELEMFSNSQIQASALATNALVNDKINRLVYNVYALVDKAGNFQHDSFFGFLRAQGTRRAMLTFIWTKNQSNGTSYIDWELKIIGMDDSMAEKIQTQVNAVSSLVDSSTLGSGKIDSQRDELGLQQRLHGTEVFEGGERSKSLDDVLSDSRGGE